MGASLTAHGNGDWNNHIDRAITTQIADAPKSRSIRCAGNGVIGIVHAISEEPANIVFLARCLAFAERSKQAFQESSSLLRPAGGMNKKRLYQDSAVGSGQLQELLAIGCLECVMDAMGCS